MRDPVIKQDELERLLGAALPEAFSPGTGLVILAIWHGGCRIRQDFSENSLRPGGTISGPTMMVLADVGIYVALHASIGWTPLAVTTSLNINFLKKPGPAGARSRMPAAENWQTARCGRRVDPLDGDEDLVAHATVTYSIPSRD